MEIVFLKAKQPLQKQISIQGTSPYPLSKNFTSYHHKIDKTQKGIDTFFKVLTKYSKEGACLYKGPLKRK